MKNAILVLMALVLVTLGSIVPWADAQQKPSNVLIWCQNTNGTSSPCVAGNALDYDTGGGTVNQGTVGLVFPASGGPVAAPGNATDGLLVNLGANNDVTVTSGTVTANAGTNLNTSLLLTTSAHDAAFGTAGSADAQVRTVQGIASMTPLQVQSNSANLATESTLGTLLTSATFTGRLPAAFSSADNVAAQTATALHGLTYIWDGANWDRWTGAVTGSGNFTVVQATGTNLHMVCDSGCSSAAGFADNAAFTFGTTAVNPIAGVLDDTATNAATENSAAIARITAQKALHMNLRNVSGTEIGTSGAPLRIDPTGTTPQPVTQSGSWSLAANQSVNFNQIGGNAVATGAGNTGIGSPRVTEATDSQLSAGVGATGDAAATAGSTGSITAKLRLMTSQLDTISTNLSSLLTSSQLVDDDQTGASVHYRTSAGATEDEHEVKGSAGRLFSITATNTNAAVRYLRCANQVAASTTPGTTTVFLGLAIPGATTGAGFTTNFGPMGIAFSTGLTCWLVTGAADTDVAEVAANEIKVFYSYK